MYIQGGVAPSQYTFPGLQISFPGKSGEVILRSIFKAKTQDQTLQGLTVCLI